MTPGQTQGQVSRASVQLGLSKVRGEFSNYKPEQVFHIEVAMKLLLPATFGQLVAAATRNFDWPYTYLVCTGRAATGRP